MAKVGRVKQLDVSASVEHTMDSNVKTALEVLDIGYIALVHEVVKNGEVEGTLLYIPGVNYKTLRGK